MLTIGHGYRERQFVLALTLFGMSIVHSSGFYLFCSTQLKLMYQYMLHSFEVILTVRRR